ncbi:MAG: helix-turn-helix domain-containing protein [Pseudolabrys sp.]|nr:helix-turn-helix domain-containing protein [Pseudolabrys sp.]
MHRAIQDTIDESPSNETSNTANRTEISAPLQRLACSVVEAAAVSNLSRSKLYELLRTGELQSIKVAGRRLIRHTELLSLLGMEGE